MLFLYYPKCTTCQKAKKWLDQQGADYQARDIKEDNPTLEELTDWYRRSGLPLKRFFNTSGLQYRALGLKDKLASMGEDEQLALLASDGMLVKRPILVTGTRCCPVSGRRTGRRPCRVCRSLARSWKRLRFFQPGAAFIKNSCLLLNCNSFFCGSVV